MKNKNNKNLKRKKKLTLNIFRKCFLCCVACCCLYVICCSISGALKLTKFCWEFFFSKLLYFSFFFFNLFCHITKNYILTFFSFLTVQKEFWFLRSHLKMKKKKSFIIFFFGLNLLFVLNILKVFIIFVNSLFIVIIIIIVVLVIVVVLMFHIVVMYSIHLSFGFCLKCFCCC